MTMTVYEEMDKINETPGWENIHGDIENVVYEIVRGNDRMKRKKKRNTTFQNRLNSYKYLYHLNVTIVN